MPIFCEPIPLESDAVEEDLKISLGDVRAADSLRTAAEMLEQDPAETLVVIGPQTPTFDALAFASALRMSRPAVGVILALERVDVTLLTHALRSGVREVVPAGNYAALVAACHRSRELSMRQLSAGPGSDLVSGRGGQVVTVFAAKGGCGKTTVAVNMAVALAKDTDKQVCVVDMDLGFGDVAISVQLDPARTITDALPMAGHLDTTGAASLLTRYRPGLEMLLAPVAPGDAEKITPQLVAELLAVLCGIFDYVVVDTPAQFSEHVLTVMDASAHHVLLTTPDVSSLKNLRVALDMLDLLSYPREIRSVLLNRSDSKVGLSLDDVERVLRWPIAAQIPSSRYVPISINKGVPITIASPKHPVSLAITRFAKERLLAEQEAGTGGLLNRRKRRRQPA